MPAKENQWVRISGYLFIIGVVVALVSGVIPGTIPSVGTILVVLGTLVGLLGAAGMGSVSKDEVEVFLLATVALIAAGGAGGALAGVPTLGTYLKPFVDNIAALVAPAAVILALEAIWRTGAVRVG